MDNVERMFRHLVRVIRTRYPQYLTQPFDVAELHQNILPYRHHRGPLGLDTNEEYEITLLELLGGNHGYLIVDDRMRESLQAELATRNPEPGAFRRFADAQITLSPSAVRELDSTPSSASRPNPPGAPPPPPPPARREEEAPPPPTASSEHTARTATPRAAVNTVVPRAGEHCRSCNELLPVGRAITFCPHCGENLTTVNCPACGSELELTWRFCPTCGRPSGGR